MNNGTTGDTSTTTTTLTLPTKTAAAAGGAVVAVRPNGRHGRHKQRYSCPEGMQLNVIGIPVRVKRKKIEEDEEELGREGGPIKFTSSSVNTTSAKPNADDVKIISCHDDDDDDDDGHTDVELELLLSTSLKKKIGVWSLPKGGWESDETVEEAVIRESFEESGVICKPFASALDKNHLSSSSGISLANLADENGDSLPPTLPSPFLSSSTLTSWWTSLQDRYTAHLDEVAKDGSKRVLEENWSFVDDNYTERYDYHHHLSSPSSISASAPSGEETPAATNISKKQMMSSRTWMFPFVIRQEPRGFDPVKNKDQVGKLHHIFPVLVTGVLPDESYPQGDVRRREWITVAKKSAKKKTKRESSSFASSPESPVDPLLSQVRPDQRIVIQTMIDAGLFDEILLHNS